MITIEEVIEYFEQDGTYWDLKDPAEAAAAVRAQLEEIEKLRNLVSNFASLVEMHAFTIPAPNPYTPCLLEAVVVARDQLAALKAKP